jgi:hypothetical protein
MFFKLLVLIAIKNNIIIENLGLHLEICSAIIKKTFSYSFKGPEGVNLKKIDQRQKRRRDNYWVCFCEYLDWKLIFYNKISNYKSYVNYHCAAHTVHKTQVKT